MRLHSKSALALVAIGLAVGVGFALLHAFKSVTQPPTLDQNEFERGKESVIYQQKAPFVNDTTDSVKPASTPQTTTIPVPIRVQLYSRAPGNKACRGNVVANINLLSPPPTAPKCYNIPSTARCGAFMGNMEDGCQAKTFGDANCQTLTNLVVFTPENRPQGGLIKSLEITCGIESKEPPPLRLPGM